MTLLKRLQKWRGTQFMDSSFWVDSYPFYGKASYNLRSSAVSGAGLQPFWNSTSTAFLKPKNHLAQWKAQKITHLSHSEPGKSGTGTTGQAKIVINKENNFGSLLVMKCPSEAPRHCVVGISVVLRCWFYMVVLFEGCCGVLQVMSSQVSPRQCQINPDQEILCLGLVVQLHR